MLPDSRIEAAIVRMPGNVPPTELLGPEYGGQIGR